MIDESEIERRFTYYPPTDRRGVEDERAGQHVIVRGGMKEAAKLILLASPPGREQSLAITKLEEAMMWANAAIARPEPPPDVTKRL